MLALRIVVRGIVVGTATLLIAAVALAVLAACTSNNSTDDATPTTQQPTTTIPVSKPTPIPTTTPATTTPLDGPPPDGPPPLTLTARQEPPALAIASGPERQAIVAAYHDHELDALQEDDDAIDELLDWTRSSREPAARPGPHNTRWIGLTPTIGYHIALPDDRPSAGCSDYWLTFIDIDSGHEILRFTPGICIGQGPDAPRPILTESISYLSARPDWVVINNVRLPHHYTDSERDNPEWVWPEPAAILDRSTYQVPPDTSVPILPQPDERRSRWQLGSDDIEGGAETTSAARMCLIVYVDAGDPGPDGTVTFDLDVRDADDQPLDATTVVPAAASPHTLTAFSLAPLPIRDPTTITLHARDGTIDTWAPAARGC